MKNKTIILSLIIVLLGLISMTTYFFDYIGIIDIKSYFYNTVNKYEFLQKMFKKEKVSKIDILAEEVAKKQESVMAMKQELESKEAKLKSLEEQLKAKEKELVNLENDFNRRRELFKEERKKEETLEARYKRLSEYYSQMRPTDAANKLANLEDEVIIGIFRNMSTSNVSFILSNMPDTVAARVTRKIASQSQ